MGDIESRKATVRAQYEKDFEALLLRSGKALDKAAKYFGVEPSGRLLKEAEGEKDPLLRTKKKQEANAYVTSLLAHLMAEVLFGKPGRSRQIKDWTDDKLRHLGRVYWYLATAHPQLRDPKIAKMISERDVRWFGDDPERIRQRLPKAKRIFYEECAQDVEDGYVRGETEDVAVLKRMGLSWPEPRIRNFLAGPHLGKPWILFDLDQ
jgi:hypothetical protein